MNKRDKCIQALAGMPNLMINGSVTIQDVIDELKKPYEWQQIIADNQLANSPNGYEEEMTLKYLSGVWNGLQMAYEIITGGDNDE